MLQRKFIGCDHCVESSSCKFSSEFCPKAELELRLNDDLMTDPTFKKYREYYQRFDR